MPASEGNAAQIDKLGGIGQAKLHAGDQALPARQQPRSGLRLESLPGLLDRRCTLVME